MKKRLLAVLMTLCLALNGSVVFADELPDFEILSEEGSEEMIQAADEAAPEDLLINEEIPVTETLPAEEAFVPAANAASGVCGDNLTWTYDGNGTLTISGTGDMSWGERPWNDLQEVVKKVIIEEGATSICSNAFYSFHNLTEVSIPQTVTSIGGQAFSNCIYLTSVVLPESLTSIAGYAFENCQRLSSINIPASAKSIGANAFCSCFVLKSITLPEGLESIRSYAFAESGLESIVIPDSVTEISYSAFDSCRSLRTVVLPSGLTEIPSSLFRFCTSLKMIEIPDSVTSIGYDAFTGCTSLLELEVPFAVEEIGSYAFGFDYENNTGNAPTKIPGFAAYVWKDSKAQDFCSDNGLTSYHINGYCGETNDTDMQWHFDRKTGTLTFSGTGYMIENVEDWSCLPGGQDAIRKIVLEEGIESVGDFAFELSNELTEVIFPSTLTLIGQRSFAFAGKLAKLTFPEGLQRIRYYAFAHCTSLKEVTLPSCMICLDEDIFSYCSGLQTVTIPDGCQQICIRAFFDCASLTSVIIPDSVETIGEYALGYRFEALATDQAVPAAQFTIYGRVGSAAQEYAQNGGFTFIPISGGCGPDMRWHYDNNGTLTISGTGAMEWTESPWSDKKDTVKKIIIEEGVTSICSSAFRNFSSLTEVVLPESLADIPYAAFQGCSSLSRIEIPAGCTVIWGNAFMDCSALTEVSLPDDLKKIEAYAFSRCTSLSELTIPEGVETIGISAFYNCPMESITIPRSVTSIENQAFGYRHDSSTSSQSSAYKDFVVYGYSGTAAETYANENGFTFVVLESEVRLMSDCRVKVSIPTYTGEPLFPEIVVHWIDPDTGELILLEEGEDRDYVVIYPGDHTNAGMTTVRIEGRGLYSGMRETSFPISKRQPQLYFEESVVRRENTADPFINPLVTDTDGVITYSSSDPSVAAVDPNSGEVTIISAGTTHITATAEAGNNYQYRTDDYLLIVNWAEGYPIDITTCDTTLAYTSCSYNGKARKPAVTVMNGTTVLTKGKDYKLSYSANTAPGVNTAIVTITGTGSYTGTVAKKFSIIKKITPAVTLSASSYVYNGTVRKPSVTVKDGTAKLAAGDYKVSYASGRKLPGKYTVTVTLKGKYEGKKTVSFKIVPKGTSLSTLKKGTSSGKQANSSFTVTWAGQKAQTSGYQIQYSTASGFPSGSKTKTKLISKNTTTSATIKDLKAGTKYYVRIRTYKLVDGVRYYSSWSSKKSVTLSK